MSKFLDKLLGRSKIIYPKEPEEVGVYDEWDFVVWWIPLDKMAERGFQGTGIATMQFIRTQCDIVGSELYVKHITPNDIFKVLIADCVFYKNVIYK